MANKPLIFVANWKMNSSSELVQSFCQQNLTELTQLGKNKNATIIICPSFTELSSTAALVKDTGIFMGAQDCSPHTPGPHTGDVSAQQLTHAGCTYSIVGHSERGEAREIVAQKVARLTEQNITPIICFGEQESTQNSPLALQNQVEPIIKAIKTLYIKPKKLLWAYEPLWAIGTGNVPNAEQIQGVFLWLSGLLAGLIEHDRVIMKYLYGGSVNENTSQKIACAELLNGFLIGSASLNFKKFQNIVLLNSSMTQS